MSNVTYRCFGCGVELQNNEPSLTGYTPKPLGLTGNVLCQRCYRLQHYGFAEEEGLIKPDYKKILDKAIKKNNLFVYVVDVFNFEGSIIKEAHEFIKNNPILVVVNKRDILPKSCNDNKIKEFIKEQFNNYGIRPVDIVITSAKKGTNVDEWIELGKQYRNNKDLYLIGASSSGKSSLINSFMHHYKNESRNLISTSPYPGTTVSTITIPLDNHSYIYDTPGILIPDSMYFKVEKTALKRIIPKTEIKPKSYQLNKIQCLILGGLARFEVVDGARTNCTVYASNDVEVLRCKIDRANKTFDNLVEGNRIQPISNTVTGSESLVAHEFILPEKSVDIVIFGYLWVNVKGNGQKIILKAPKGVGVCVRDAII